MPRALIGAAHIHAGPAADGLKAFEHLDMMRAIFAALAAFSRFFGGLRSALARTRGAGRLEQIGLLAGLLGGLRPAAGGSRSLRFLDRLFRVFGGEAASGHGRLFSDESVCWDHGTAAPRSSVRVADPADGEIDVRSVGTVRTCFLEKAASGEGIVKSCRRCS
jgi:hypothetical protein